MEIFGTAYHGLARTMTWVKDDFGNRARPIALDDLVSEVVHRKLWFGATIAAR